MARKKVRSEWHESNGFWSKSLGHRGVRIRLYQKKRDGVFYRAVWQKGKGSNRRALGTFDKVEADRLGKELLRHLLDDSNSLPTGPLSLGVLWEFYSTKSAKFLDNARLSRLTDAHHAKTLIGFFGADKDVALLTEDDQVAFIQKRLEGGIVLPDGRIARRTGMSSAAHAMALLKTMLRWATTYKVKGRKLLPENPLANVSRPTVKNPRRPRATDDRFDATRKAIKALVKSAPSEMKKREWMLLEIALVFAYMTGRRIGSICKLEWADIDFTKREITWRPEHDKKGKKWIVPIDDEFLSEIRTFRMQSGIGFGRFVLPALRSDDAPIRRDVLILWLLQAERKANLPKLDGSVWHAYRRAWATERKDLPLVDVMHAGGWSDHKTLLESYQQPDEDTLRAVMGARRRSKKNVHKQKSTN